MFYQENRKRARTVNNQPTMTDQAGAKDTDLNVIVGRMLTTNTVPGAASSAIYGDFTGLPKDLREMIHTARDIERLRGELPTELAGLTVEDLVGLSPDSLKAILMPPQTDKPKEEPKT